MRGAGSRRYVEISVDRLGEATGMRYGRGFGYGTAATKKILYIDRTIVHAIWVSNREKLAEPLSYFSFSKVPVLTTYT